MFLMFVGIANPDAVNIRNQRSAAEGKANCNPKKTSYRHYEKVATI